jgi:hypothetical protein
VAKDKKKKDGKKAKTKGDGATLKKGKAKPVATKLTALADNPVVVDIVATALVATAAALKDSKKARALATQAGDELEALAKSGADRGNALWQLALDVGKKALDEFAGSPPKRNRK